MSITVQTTFKTSDGKSFDNQPDAKTWESLVQLVMAKVPYTDGKNTVLNFLDDNKEALKEILKG